MDIEGSKVLVLGGYGLVGMAVCRELLEHKPREIQIHSLRQDESEEALEQLLPFAGSTRLTTSSGDIFGLLKEAERRVQVWAQLKQLRDKDLPSYRLYSLLYPVMRLISRMDSLLPAENDNAVIVTAVKSESLT